MKQMVPLGLYLILTILISCVFVSNVMAETSTIDIFDTATIHEDECWYYSIYPDSSSDSYEIYIHWESDYQIDVYLVDEHEYNRFKNGESITTLYNADGTSGIISVTLAPYQYNDAPYYAIFDNTDYGDAQPAWDGIDNIAYVIIDGELTSHKSSIFDDNDDNDSSSSSSDYLLCLSLAVIGGIVIIVIIILIYSSKKRQPPYFYPPQQPPPQAEPIHPSQHYPPQPPPPL